MNQISKFLNGCFKARVLAIRLDEARPATMKSFSADPLIDPARQR